MSAYEMEGEGTFIICTKTHSKGGLGHASTDDFRTVNFFKITSGGTMHGTNLMLWYIDEFQIFETLGLHILQV